MQALLLDRPRSLDASADGDGSLVVLDHDGMRICQTGREPLALDRAAQVCRFHGDNLALLFDDGELRMLRPDGTRIGKRQGKPGGIDLAVTAGGSVYISYVDDLERVGETPMCFQLQEGGVLAVEGGGVWVAGERRAIKLRPAPGGLDVRDEIPLPAPVRAAAVGPDGDLYLLLEPGDRILSGSGAEHAIDTPLVAIARAGRQLVGAGPAGIHDLTRFVPRAEGDGPEFPLPNCSSS